MQNGSHSSLVDVLCMTWSFVVGRICYNGVERRMRARITTKEQELEGGDEARRCSVVVTMRMRVIYARAESKT